LLMALDSLLSFFLFFILSYASGFDVRFVRITSNYLYRTKLFKGYDDPPMKVFIR
jgi:hypothetical protein